MLSGTEQYTIYRFAMNGLCATAALLAATLVVCGAADVKLKVTYAGRLGNRLFQLMSTLGIAEVNDLQACGDNAIDLPGVSDDVRRYMRLRPCDEGVQYTRVMERGHARYTEFPAFARPSSPATWLQSFRYLTSTFTSLLPAVAPMTATHATVGIHVRRTDHLNSGYVNFPPWSYFAESIAYFKTRYTNVQFHIGTDDPAWVREHFLGDEYHLLTGTPEEDLVALARCDSIILSVGTFGWWAAFLGPHMRRGTVIYYRDEWNLQHRINMPNRVVTTDYYPPYWLAFPRDTAEISSFTTIVTAYFEMPAKHPTSQYQLWMSNALSLRDAMVIYTTEGYKDQVMTMRQHSLHNTRVVVMSIRDMWCVRHHNRTYWQHQFDMDPEARIHKSPMLYWIWCEKARFLQHVAAWDPFHSTYFSWIDIGYFRDDAGAAYRYRRTIPQLPADMHAGQVLMLEVTAIVKQRWVGGGYIGATASSAAQWAQRYYDTVDAQGHNTFVGKDQPWMYATCQRYPDLCVLLPVTGSSAQWWFSMRPRLFHAPPLPQPIVVVGIFNIFSALDVERAFLDWLPNVAGPLQPGLNFRFVYGQPAIAAPHRVTLAMSENMNEGKSWEWFREARRVFPDATYIYKMDTDTSVCPPTLSALLHGMSDAHVEYVGWRHNHISCGRAVKCPPAGNSWGYAAGGFYGLAVSLIDRMAVHHGARTPIGDEDLEIGRLVHEVGGGPPTGLQCLQSTRTVPGGHIPSSRPTSACPVHHMFFRNKDRPRKGSLCD